jgi:hypothetical protein
MDESKKCAHPSCRCMAKKDSNYCSTYCEGEAHTPRRIRRTSSAVAAIPNVSQFKGTAMRVISDFLFLILFFLLLGAWVLLWAAFHIAGGLVHILLVIAVIALILHLVRGRSAA